MEEKANRKSGRKLLAFVISIVCLISMFPNNVWAMNSTQFMQNSVSAGDIISGEQTVSSNVSVSDNASVSSNAGVSGNDTVSSGNLVLKNSADEIMLLSNISGSINLSQYNNGGDIVLDGDAVASGQCQLTNKELTIDLNGHTLTMANGAYFMLNGEQSILNIKDSTGSGVIYASCQLVWGYGGGTFNLYGGILDGSRMTSKPQQGGCVNLYRSNMGANVFNMYGGTIRSFQATQYGGAVYVASTFSGKKHTFNMYGGTIENCYAPAGAGVYVDNSGDGPGYFYIKGGTRQNEGGESKAVINCKTYNGNSVPNAIYNYGYLGMEGVVDIDGIVYLDQNNWASTITHFIKITGRLIVVGDGYIDIDSAYPNSNAICTGHTVVENVTQTVGGTAQTISPEEFYTYSSYFINSTKGLMVSAGFSPGKNTTDSNGAPANWPQYQADKYSKVYTYVDVMGQNLVIQSSDSPGQKRQMQNENYLIYTERANPEEPYKEYYSVKLIKKDMVSGSLLNGAKFVLKRQITDEEGTITGYETIGNSGLTGDITKGLNSGEAYIYLPAYDGKLMIDDGIYILEEESAPEGYHARGAIVTLRIYHKIDETSGKKVSVVEVRANEKILVSSEQVINSTYQDSGWISNREIVLSINNTDTPLVEDTEYKIRVQKYSDAGYSVGLKDVTFQVQNAEDTSTVAWGVTDANGIADMLDKNNSQFTFSKGDNLVFLEAIVPAEYFAIDKKIKISVNDEGKLLINNVEIGDGETVFPTNVVDKPTYGSWKASLAGDMLTFWIYNEQKPPTWTLKARKYGTKKIEELALSGAKFVLYKKETMGGADSEVEVATVNSSDGTDGLKKGELAFVDEYGELLELSCNSTYILRETNAPMGYSVIADLIIQVNEDCSDITVMQNGSRYAEAEYDADGKVLTLAVIDKTVYRMPETGGRGIAPFEIGGTFVMCISVVIGAWHSGKGKGRMKGGGRGE